MSATLTCLALALVGVDIGYQPAPNGGAEFIIQIDPATFRTLRPDQSFELDVQPEARNLRPSHFSITLGNKSLPHVLPAAASASSVPPATAPIVSANPVVPAGAASPPLGTSPAEEPMHVRPPSSTLPKSSVAHGGPLLSPTYLARPPAAARSTASWIGSLAPVGPGGGNPGQPDQPWLAMCLAVIALLASNIYVGWLFWDARQRYRGLLARAFSFGQPAAEA